MKKVSIVTHQDYVENLVKGLHKEGLMEIIDISKEEPKLLEEFERAESHPEAENLSNYEIRLSRLIGILKKVAPKKKGIKAILDPDLPKIKDVEDLDYEDLYSYSEGILSEIENSILKHKEQIDKINEEKEFINQEIEQLEYLKSFDFDLKDLAESKYLIVTSGITLEYDELKEKIKDKKLIEVYEKSFKFGKKIKHCVVIISHISKKEEIEKIKREFIDEFHFKDLSGKPNQLLKDLKNKIKELESLKKKIRLKLKKYSKDQLDELLSLKEQITLERIRKEVSKNFSKTNYTFLIKGWVLEKNKDKLKDLISVQTKNKAIIEFKTPSKNPDNPPTYIKTPRWAEGFKGLVEMFSMPKYGEINPTIIMGIFFILFFGVMLGDAGYGLVILVLSLFGYFKLGKHSSMFRNWSFMGIWMGIVTFTFGFLTNSFFGNLVPLFIYGKEGALLYDFHLFGYHIKPIVDPIKDPISILVLALVFGLIQLNVGIFLSLIQVIKDKKYKELLTIKSCWIPLQIGGGILIGSSILGFSFSQPIIYLGIIFAIIGFIQLLISAGPIGFFDITGYVGDWLSYARLLALGLATAGMALAFNVVAKLLGDMIPVIGLVITIIIVIFAHIINLILQALGAGIHSLRLQYVEFFNRFYEGGGREFSPFKIKRKYTKLKEETE